MRNNWEKWEVKFKWEAKFKRELCQKKKKNWGLDRIYKIILVSMQIQPETQHPNTWNEIKLINLLYIRHR